MTHKRISTITRILLLICGFGLLAVLFTPMWRIDLQAPQYPEGLRMLIYANKLAGNVDIINGLNHYIGMKTLHDKDFPEFKILPGIIILFSILFFVAAAIARRRWMNIFFILFVAFGVVAIIDFWRWEYDYGHNLNPDAAIIVPGMSYQPPLIGFKQLLNFGAYSMPATGGWIFVSVGAVLLCAVIYEWKRTSTKTTRPNVTAVLFVAWIMGSLSACSNSPQPISLGKDHCEFCKMTVTDNRFGAEIVTAKNKIYKFDDEHCIMAFLNANTVARNNIAAIYFTDFCSPHQLLHVDKALFLQSPSFKSPMNGNIAAFSHEDSLIKTLPKFYGNKITWEEMQK